MASYSFLGVRILVFEHLEKESVGSIYGCEY